MVRERNEKGKERMTERKKKGRKKERKRDTLEFLFNKSRQFRYYFVQNIDLQLFKELLEY